MSRGWLEVLTSAGLPSYCGERKGARVSNPANFVQRVDFIHDRRADVACPAPSK